MKDVTIVNLVDDWEQELICCKECIHRNTEECPIKEGKIYDTFYCGAGEPNRE